MAYFLTEIRLMWEYLQFWMRYYEFKLDVYRRQETDRQTDLVPEVAPPEVGHLKI